MALPLGLDLPGLFPRTSDTRAERGGGDDLLDVSGEGYPGGEDQRDLRALWITALFGLSS